MLRGPRLWETLRIDAGWPDVDLFAEPGDGKADDIRITADESGFTVSNSSPSDAAVLVTLMARATDAEESRARSRLMALTAVEGRVGPLRVPSGSATDAYARLWQNDIEVRERVRGGWVATRSGMAVLPVPTGAAFVLVHDPAALHLGVVVAAVAAVGVGSTADASLVSVDRGSWASIGETPGPRS